MSAPNASKTRYRMFIDDTGGVQSTASNHPQQRFASITGIIFEWDYYHQTFENSFQTLKQKHFGVTPSGKAPVLQLRRLKKAEGPFHVLLDAVKRASWERDVLSMYTRAKYTAITVSVDKIQFYAAHPTWQGSFYEMLVANAIERYFYFLRKRGEGDVMAEAINKDLDDELRCLYSKFYESGTDHIPATFLREVLTSKEIKIKPKNKDIAGLQMADLLASTCFNHCRRLYASGPSYDRFAMSVANVVEGHKFYRDDNDQPHGYGRIWRP